MTSLHQEQSMPMSQPALWHHHQTLEAQQSTGERESHTCQVRKGTYKLIVWPPKALERTLLPSPKLSLFFGPMWNASPYAAPVACQSVRPCGGEDGCPSFVEHMGTRCTWRPWMAAEEMMNTAV